MRPRTLDVPSPAGGLRSLITALCLILASGCDGAGGEGGGGSGGGTGSTTTGGDTGSTTAPREPLPWPYDEAVTLPIREIQFGDLGPDGTPSPAAWSALGFDLDGKKSTASSTDLCKPVAGADINNVYPDGQDGLDNNFGKLVVPLVEAASPGFWKRVNEGFEAGRANLIIHIPQGQSSELSIHTHVHLGQFPPDVVPAWDGADQWPVRSDLLNDGNIDDPKIQFPHSYLIDGPSGGKRWVSGDFGTVSIFVSQGTAEMTLYLRHAVLVLDFDADPAGATGTLAGILDTEQLVAELSRLAPDELTPCLTEEAYQALATAVRQASDIPNGGTQDPEQTCDGISVGLHFFVGPAQLGPVVDPSADPDPCPP